MSLTPGTTFGLRLLTQRRVQVAILATLTAAVLLLRVVQFAIWTQAPQWGYDFSFYWTAAGHLLHGEPIYSATQLAGPYAPQAQEGFLYPPVLAALVTPLALLFPDDYGAANWVWSTIGAAILVWSILTLAREERLDLRFPLLAGRGRWWLVAAAVAFPPVIDELVVGNVHLLLVGLLTAAWVGVKRGGPGGDRLAGIAVGAAALVKVFPGLLIVWFALTGRWRAVAWSIAAALVLAALSLPITGLQPWLDYPTVLANLSLTPDATDALAPTFWLAPYLGFTVARLAVTAAGLALLLWVVSRTRVRGVPELARADQRIPFATTIVLSVLMTPALYTSYLTVLLVPLVLGLAVGLPLGWLGLAYL
ncbi:MAG TPA: glycosyltransferase family 87 protein, partial [Candidatus Limnocylindrales bacterium]